MPSKYYVVWVGREPGVYSDWTSCKRQVDKFPGAKYKSFPSKEIATEAYAAGHGAAASRSTSPSKSRSSKPKPGTLTAEQVDAVPAQVKLFTDGGCEPNPGNAGSGVALYRQDEIESLWFGLYNPNGTNNTAELHALHQALLMAHAELAAGNSVAIFCDSQYAIQCITQWAVGWEKSKWTRKSGEIKNLAIIQAAYASYLEVQGRVEVLHVNGHVGVEGNELADRMSLHAIATQEADFVAYPEPIDLPSILAMRSG